MHIMPLTYEYLSKTNGRAPPGSPYTKPEDCRVSASGKKLFTRQFEKEVPSAPIAAQGPSLNWTAEMVIPGLHLSSTSTNSLVTL